MSIQVTVTLTETHINDVTFTIEKLPSNWDEIKPWEQHSYVQKHGTYVGEDCEFYEVDSVDMVLTTFKCARCQEDVTFEFVADDGTGMYTSPNGYLVCQDFTESDENGEYRPVHTPPTEGDPHERNQQHTR